MEIYQTLLIMGAFQAFMMAVFLFLSKNNVIPNRILVVMTVSWSVCCFTFAVQSNQFWSDYPHLFRTTSIFLFSFFPPIYLYTKYVTSTRKKFDKRDLLHFIPTLLFFVSGLPFYILSAEEKRQVIFNADPAWIAQLINVSGEITNWVMVLQGFIYSFLSIKHLKKFNIKIKEVVSDNETLTFNWLRNLIIATVVIWMMGSAGTLWDWVRAEDGIIFYQITYLSIVVMIYFISYNALRQPEIFKELQWKEGDLEDIIEEETVSVEHYDEEQNADAQKLRKYITEKKPYLNTKLTLQQLVDDLGFTRNQLSALIYHAYNAHFYDVMNEYRLEEAIALLEDASNDDIKLEILAYKAGFNTKATFNRLFKLKMGSTPSEFRKQRKAKVEEIA